MVDLFELLRSLPYPGRGLFIGKSEDGEKAILFYFLTGRSVNSRNRIFVKDGQGIRTEAFDPTKVTDPSLIIYAPVRVLGNKTIVTNGNQTDTVYEGLLYGKSFEESLSVRTFEPDAPNYTPRISSMLSIENSDMKYEMSLIRAANGDPDKEVREYFECNNAKAGEGYFLRTYMGTGEPLPSYEGEPVLCSTEGWGSEPEFIANKIWDAMNADNRVSLFVRVIDLSDRTCKDRIINKLQ